MELTADKVVKWTLPSAPAGVTPGKVFIGPDPHGLGGFQAAIARATVAPSRQVLRDLHVGRLGKKQAHLVVAVVHAGTTHLFGPDPQAQPVALRTEQAHRQLQSVLDEPDVLAAADRWAGFRKAHDSTAVPGFTNSGLFATHHLTQNVPQRPDWETLNETGNSLLSARGQKLVQALGFATAPAASGALLLSTAAIASAPRAVAVLLDDSEHFETKSQRFQLSPVAFGLAVAAQQGVPWLVVLRKDQIRLYPGRDGVGVGAKGQAETYFEIDLATVDADYAGLLPLIFTADALAADGTTAQLLADSARYATELGARLRERIYEEIVPTLAVEVAHQLARHAGQRFDADGLAVAYRVTLRILFRLLFQAYAEDRGLLPSGRNEGFDANSLKTNAQRLATTDADFGDSTTLWLDLVQVWDAIDQGNASWQIPAYNGGLFSSDPDRSADGALFTKLKLPDSVLGPALKHLLIDTAKDGTQGPVDFRSLSVREFGTIYEGLLESSLSKAEQPLTVDASGAWVPAKDGDIVDAPAGAVYFHSASGERKATGSYFTPQVVVDHLIERSITPALSEHLAKIETHLNNGDPAAAARDFFDFRVADLAMGSGHFLVAAVDKIEALMRDFLTQHAVPGVTDELLRLASAAKDALGTDDVAKSEVDEIGLLRRQVARRCIYGLDINPMAVELARLALWIHTFVPGLPMSNLDHGLVNANSLTGIGTPDEALDVLQPERAPGQASFFDSVLTDTLSSAKALLVDLANAGEASKAEVEESARLLEQAQEAAAPAQRMFDVAVAARVGVVDADLIFTEDDISELALTPAVVEVVKDLRPAHMPVLFPEVFLRSNPGFDVLLGNPPWEAPHAKEDRWWNLRFPGLITMDDKSKSERIASLIEQRPDLASQYDEAVGVTDRLRAALLALRLPGLGTGHVDLYQVFAWRNWQLLRQGGRAALVLPRGAHSGSGLTAWRREVLSKGSFTDVCFIENTGRWAFDMEPRYTIGLTVTAKGGARQVRWAGPFADEEDFRRGSGDLAMVPADEFQSWSDTAAFFLISDTVSVDVFRQMKKSAPFGKQAVDGALRPTRGDLLRWKRLAQTGDARVPIRSGRSFNIWSPDATGPRAEVNQDDFRSAYLKYLVTASRNKRSAHFGRTFKFDELPIDQARIALRWISRATDSRTCKVALLPPGCATDDSASVMHRLAGTQRHEAYILGVLSSIPFDWQARLLIEMNFTFEVLNQLSIPGDAGSGVMASRVVEVAGRLAAVDDRYADWAKEVGVPVGSVKTEAERADFVAELDALVSLLYGLDEDQVEHVFATFHRGWNYEPRLEQVLTHYADWKGRA